jgi:hypothetical protein
MDVTITWYGAFCGLERYVSDCPLSRIWVYHNHVLLDIVRILINQGSTIPRDFKGMRYLFMDLWWQNSLRIGLLRSAEVVKGF